MSLQTQINSFVLRVAQEFNAVAGKIGSLAGLSTRDKSNLVAAINELQAAVAAAVAIDDGAVSSSSTYSSSKIVALLDALKAEILGGADAAYDTLLEIQQAIQSGDSAIAALLEAVNKRVRYDAAQSLTAAEQAQARDNIGAIASMEVGDTGFDFVAAFEAALV